MHHSERYSRQNQVDNIDKNGQEQLANTSVLIVGAGGLGCQLGAQLAGAGIGKITLVDSDLVSISNLHRQILFRENDIGKKKSVIATRELKSINSEIEIQSYCQRLNQSNITDLIGDAAIVVDAADNFLTSYILSDYCYINRIPLVSASVNSTFGWVAVFCGTKLKPAPSIRAVFPQISSQLINCDTVGVTGPSVGIIASIQAQEVLKVALNDDAQLNGKLLYLDLWNYQQHVVDFSNSEEPDHDSCKFVTSAKVSTQDLVVDVRNSNEVTESPLEFDNLVNIPLSDLTNNTQSLPQDDSIVLACKSGQRALIAAQQLAQKGYKKLAVLTPDE